MAFWSKFFKDANQKVIEKIQPLIAQINQYSIEFEKLGDQELRLKTDKLKETLAQGKTLDDILAEAFALVREANRRTIKVRHFDVQLVGAVVLHRGEIAEMKTGEGKTHVAALALYLNALESKGAHLITVNDYLAKRDAAWNGPANYLLGLQTACLVHDQALIFDPLYNDETQSDERIKHLKPCSRKEAYAADITYGTNSEFGFDYLRDNMAGSLEQTVQRDLHYAIVDEVDSVLIDEARTPLIISAPAEESAGLYKKFAQMVPRLRENEDYNVDEKMRAAALTDAGVQRVEQWLGMGNIYNEGGIQFVHHLEQALNAHALYKRDKDYIVKDGEIIIIDEFTGRLMHGRRYSEGLHQAIEAKEGVEVQKESRTLATITIQNYFRMYKKLAGMTGTAATEAEEFSKIYGLDVTVVPTNRPVVRRDLSDRIYSSERGKLQAVVSEIKNLHEKGQPVLVGTISIEKNEMLSALLTQAGVAHQLLNAKHHEKEAQIIAQAGRVGSVTVATNMAGRGVDIILGGAPFSPNEYEKVKALGGLFVLGTERHEARRIDNQLRGRSGRQGDPGASQFYISMEDDLMRVFGTDRVKRMMQNMGLPEDMPIENRFVSNAIEKAQQRVEGNNFDIRKHLVEYDDVINKQRTIIYKNRREILRAAKENVEAAKQKILEMVEEEIKAVVLFHTAGEDQAQWNLKEICEVAGTIFPVSAELRRQVEALQKVAGNRQEDAGARTDIIDLLVNEAKRQYDLLEKAVIEHTGAIENMRLIEKEILIRSIDNLWVEHLDAVYALRTGIGLRGYGQRDPLIEFKKETFQMFVQLQNLIQKQVVYAIYKIGFTTKFAKSVMESDNVRESGAESAGQFQFEQKKQRQAASFVKKARTAGGEKIGRNDPCPCGSGLKYKKCHGA
jgi:preprotein translocase subunit SecA